MAAVSAGTTVTSPPPRSSYLLTREFQLKGEMRQEWDRSNIPGANYVASVWLLGLRLAR